MKSPFKFLDSFTKEDKDIFFGREKETDELYQKVFECKILLMYGISGTGKSSLIYCGLANKFEDSDWLPINIRRGRNINESLKKVVSKLEISPVKENKPLIKHLQSLYLDHFKPIYLIFDQFEELFIFGNKSEKEEFINEIKQIIDSDIQCKFIFVIREEYLAGVTEFERDIPTFLQNRIRLEKMTSANAKQAIEGPCKVYGIKVEEGFSQALLEKLSPNTTEVELTYMQVFLDKVYRETNGRSFECSVLDKLGDVKDLLGSFLEEQIIRLDDPDTALAILKSFVSVKGTKRQNTEGEVNEHCKTIGKNIDYDTYKNQIQHFVNIRIFRDKDETGRYELRHDALAAKIYEKITLVEKELMEIRQFIENERDNYDKRNILLSANDLKYIAPYEDKLFLNQKLEQFIEKSKNEIQKAKRRKRNIAIAAVIVLIVVLSVFSYWALSAKKTAEKQLYENIKSSLSISTEKMLVLYRGIDNPVSISVSGVDKANLFPSIINGSIRGDTGSYMVRPGGAHTVVINVKGFTYFGDTIDFGSKSFRVKDVPSPLPRIADKIGGVITKKRLLHADSIIIELPGFVFDLSFRAMSYTFYTVDDSDNVLHKIEVNNGKLNNNVKDVIKLLKEGDRVFFKEIIAIGPDGRNRNMESISFKIVSAASSLESIIDLKMLLREFSAADEWNNYSITALINKDLFSFDETILNEIAWNLFLHVDEKDKLEYAAACAKKSLTLKKDDLSYYITNLCILYQLNRKNEALEIEQSISKLGEQSSSIDLYTIYNNIAYDLLFARKYDLALLFAIKGIEINKTEEIIYTKLALAYLLKGEYNKSEEILLTHRETKINNGTFREYILTKLKELESEGITHADFSKVRELLKVEKAEKK